MRSDIIRIAVQRQSQIQQKPGAIGHQLDARPADFLASTVDTNAHESKKPMCP
jgi:hypothetical protein